MASVGVAYGVDLIGGPVDIGAVPVDVTLYLTHGVALGAVTVLFYPVGSTSPTTTTEAVVGAYVTFTAPEDGRYEIVVGSSSGAETSAVTDCHGAD